MHKIKMSKHTTRSDTTRIFQINDENVDQILFCDKSDTEEALVLDEEDIGFLQQDVEHLEDNNKANETMEVILNLPRLKQVLHIPVDQVIPVMLHKLLSKK